MTINTEVDRRSLWRAFAASLSGTSLERYDSAYIVVTALLTVGLALGRDPVRA